MVQIRFVAKMYKGNSLGTAAICIPKNIAKLMEFGKRYEFAVIKTEDGFEV